MRRSSERTPLTSARQTPQRRKSQNNVVESPATSRPASPMLSPITSRHQSPAARTGSPMSLRRSNRVVRVISTDPPPPPPSNPESNSPNLSSRRATGVCVSPVEEATQDAQVPTEDLPASTVVADAEAVDAPPLELPAEAPCGQCEELLAVRDQRRAALQSIEQELRVYATMAAVKERQSRTNALRSKIPEVQAQIDHMKHEMGSLRNSDRLVVTLRDDFEALSKHLRLRRAQVRQKEATIDIIDRRYEEQGGGSRLLLDGISDELRLAEMLCRDQMALERNCESCDPMPCLLRMIEVDSEAYVRVAQCSAAVQRVQRASASADATLADVKQRAFDMKARVLEEASMAAGDRNTPAEVAAIIESSRRAWQQEKATLLRTKAELQAAIRDTQFHLRRGTNIKGLSQLPSQGERDLEDVRDLQLTVVDMHRDIAVREKHLEDLVRKQATLQQIHQEEIDKMEREAASSAARRASLATELQQLQAYVGILSQRCGQPFEVEMSTSILTTMDGRSVTSPQQLATPNRHLSSEALIALEQRRARIAESSAQKRPKTVLQRLTTPTKSFEASHLAALAEDAERKLRMEAMQSRRPNTSHA